MNGHCETTASPQNERFVTTPAWLQCVPWNSSVNLVHPCDVSVDLDDVGIIGGCKRGKLGRSGPLLWCTCRSSLLQGGCGLDGVQGWVHVLGALLQCRRHCPIPWEYQAQLLDLLIYPRFGLLSLKYRNFLRSVIKFAQGTAASANPSGKKAADLKRACMMMSNGQMATPYYYTPPPCTRYTYQVTKPNYPTTISCPWRRSWLIHIVQKLKHRISNS